MSVPGALHSDHVNYLILRYLQECGHEDTARAFHRDWHRPREFRDPEDLPFAPVVRRHELISVIQDGLRHDELHARVARSRRRFRWTQASARHSIDDGDVDTGPDGSRPSSSGKRKSVGLTAGMRAPDEFPTPMPKRQRVSHGSEATHVNGDRDAMDIDAVSPSAVDVEEDGEAASPAVASEEAGDIPAERYDSVATQTEVKVGPKTSTLGFTIDKPGVKVFHSAWSPSRLSKARSTLMTVGECLCRLYNTPENLDVDIASIEHIDEPALPPTYLVTAMAWHPEGRVVTCAVDSFRQLPGGKEVPAQMLINIGPGASGTTMYPSGPPLLEPAGIVLCVRFSPSGKHILVARTNIKRGLVQIWEGVSDAAETDSLPAAFGWRIFEHSLMDATWVDDDNLLVCGDHGLASNLKLATNRDPLTDHIAGAVAVRNVEERQIDLPSPETKWTMVRHDEVLGLDLFHSAEPAKLVVSNHSRDESSGDSASTTVVVDLPDPLTAMALRPRQSHKSSDEGQRPPETLLATTYHTGACNIYILARDDNGPVCMPLCGPSQPTFELSDGPALALAWSPDGAYLAVAGVDLVQIWHGDISSATNALDNRPLVTWRPNADSFGPRNGVHEMNGETLAEPSLSWNADGEKLSFAVDNKVRVLLFGASSSPLTYHIGCYHHVQAALTC